METEKQLNERIVAITLLIKEKYPELSDFLGEMPVTIPDDDDPNINAKTLKEYYDSLDVLMKKYAIEHPL